MCDKPSYKTTIFLTPDDIAAILRKHVDSIRKSPEEKLENFSIKFVNAERTVGYGMSERQETVFEGVSVSFDGLLEFI